MSSRAPGRWPVNEECVSAQYRVMVFWVTLLVGHSVRLRLFNIPHSKGPVESVHSCGCLRDVLREGYLVLVVLRTLRSSYIYNLSTEKLRQMFGFSATPVCSEL